MKILFTGDLNFRGKNELSFEKSQDIISEIKPFLEDADFRIINLECPLGDETKYDPILKSGPNLICSEANLPFLKAISADGVTLANNHIGDFGDGAVKNTLSLMKDNGILCCGAGENITEAYKAFRLVKNGKSVSIISVCENEFGIATDKSCGSAGYNPRLLFKQIKEEKGYSDFVIVVFHGGNEFNPLPSPDTTERYRFICDMGADAIIGGHTHCPQGYEIYEGKPIIYSLGNFLFKSGSEKEHTDPWYYGYMSVIEITDRLGLKIIPYKFDTDADKITPLGKEMTDYIEKLSDIIKDEELLKNYFKGWAWLHQWSVNCIEGDFGSYNIATCEAHHSQLKTASKIFAYKDFESAKHWAEEIKKLIPMPI